MNNQKHHIHLLAIAVIAILAISFLLLNSLKILAETMNSITACTMNCPDWSACSPGGTQTRTCSPYPSGCPGDTRTEEKACTYVPTNCSANCSDWNDCSSGGTQTRTCKPYPEGCPGGTTGETRSCALPDCKYSYSQWGPCKEGNFQERSYTIANQPCTQKIPPDIQQSCTYSSSGTSDSTSATTCAYSCSDWTSCKPEGYKYKTCSMPSGCSSGPKTEKQSCTYSGSPTSGSSSGTSTSTSSSSLITSCDSQCTSWSGCKPGGYKTRTCQKPYGSSCTVYEERESCTYENSGGESITVTDPGACSMACSNWSPCSPGGTKTQTCWPSPSGCPGEKKTDVLNCVPVICSPAYSPWGGCAGGFQYRSVAETYPPGCVDGNLKLIQECAAGASGGDEINQPENTGLNQPIDPENSVNDDWKNEKFKTASCPSEICGGGADPDKDGLSNNDEFRYGTDPLDRDTDNDGKTDGEEAAFGTDPLKSSAKGEEDAMAYENPNEESAGVVKSNIYKVTNIEMVEIEGGKKGLKLTGKGPVLSYITVYIYSGDPIVVTVKTDSNGDWTYTVDRELEDGNHEVYVAVTNNTGAIKAKSEPFPFIKTAQAVTATSAAEANAVQPTTRSEISIRNIFLILAVAFFAVVLAFILIGVVIKKLASKIKMN